MGKKYKKKISGLLVAFFIVGALIGVGASYVVTRNDCFVLIGSKEVIINVNDNYVDSGVKIVTFGKDISSEVNVNIYNSEDEEIDNIDTSIDGEYTIIYTIDSFKWSDYKLLRRVIVGGDSNE